MLVSVLTPSYNDGAFVADCINSVAAAADRSGISVQHIVTDDGSTDHTLAVLRSHGVTAIQFPENRGASAALNAALAIADSPWCLILAADDEVTETAFKDFKQLAARHPDANVIYSDLELFGARRGMYTLPKFDRSKLPFRNILPGASFIRTDLLRAVGGFNPAMRSAQDWDFWVRADKAIGLRPVKAVFPLVRYRQHTTPRLHNESGRNREAIQQHIRELVA